MPAIPAIWWLLGGATIGASGTVLLSDTVKKAAKYSVYGLVAYGAIKYGPDVYKALTK